MNVKPGRARNHLVPYKFATYPSEFRLAEAATKRETWTEATMATDGDDAVAARSRLARRMRRRPKAGSVRRAGSN